MSKLVRTILLIAFAIFAIGFIWAIVVAIKKPNTVVKKPLTTSTSQTTPAPTPTPTLIATPIVTAPPAPVAAPTPTPSPVRRTTTTRRTVITTYHTSTGTDQTHADAGDGTWARAGVDANGNAYAEAHAN